MGIRSGKYDLMMREFITAPPELEDDFTLRKLAAKYGRAPSSVARMARKEKWEEKRSAYRGEVYEITTTLDGEQYADRLSKLHGKAVEAAEVTLDAYITGVRKGDIVPGAGDATKLIALVRDIVNRPGGGAEEKNGNNAGITIGADLSRELLGRLEGLARERLESSAGERDLVVVSPSEGEGGRLRVR